VSAISHGLWLLLRYPAEMAKLRANPALVKDFIEEVLRFETAVPGLARMVTKDTELAGVAIPKGAMIMTRYAAANHDPAKFECPHLFDIERKDKQHMAFGAGPHLCVGRVLARREMNSVFSTLLQRMDNITLARPLPEMVHVPHMMLRPMKELYIRFDKIA
jgi:cytochrome P450